MSTLYESTLRSLPLLGRGKVRDNYAVGNDQLLIVTTDRLSAFDVIMGEPIPNKGRVLNQMANFWFDKLKHIVPNHLTGVAPESVVAADEAEQVKGRGEGDQHCPGDYLTEKQAGQDQDRGPLELARDAPPPGVRPDVAAIRPNRRATSPRRRRRLRWEEPGVVVIRILRLRLSTLSAAG